MRNNDQTPDPETPQDAPETAQPSTGTPENPEPAQDSPAQCRRRDLGGHVAPGDVEEAVGGGVQAFLVHRPRAGLDLVTGVCEDLRGQGMQVLQQQCAHTVTVVARGHCS